MPPEETSEVARKTSLQPEMEELTLTVHWLGSTNDTGLNDGGFGSGHDLDLEAMLNGFKC